MWLASFLALAVTAVDGNEAEQLFRAMEAKVERATTLDLSFQITWGEASLRSGQRLKGTLAATSGNKLRLQVTGGEANATLHLRISDGARAILRGEGDDGEPKRGRAPKNLTANYRTVVARTGVLPALLAQGYEYANDGDSFKDRHPVFGFKLGDKERVGGKEVRRVDYVFVVKGQKTRYPVTVWIDLKTELPVKRLASDGDLTWFTETYELTVDGKLDPKTFELPK